MASFKMADEILGYFVAVQGIKNNFQFFVSELLSILTIKHSQITSHCIHHAFDMYKMTQVEYGSPRVFTEYFWANWPHFKGTSLCLNY